MVLKASKVLKKKSPKTSQMTPKPKKARLSSSSPKIDSQKSILKKVTPTAREKKNESKKELMACLKRSPETPLAAPTSKKMRRTLSSQPEESRESSIKIKTAEKKPSKGIKKKLSTPRIASPQPEAVDDSHSMKDAVTRQRSLGYSVQVDDINKVTRAKLIQHFGKFGTVVKLGLSSQPTKISKSSASEVRGNVTFASKDVADLAKAASHLVDGCEIVIRPWTPILQMDNEEKAPQRIKKKYTNEDKEPRGIKRKRNETASPSGHKIFVGRLLPSATSDDLEKHFSAYGEVWGVSLHHDKKNNPPKKSFAFVSFANETAKDAALIADHEIDGQPIYVDDSRKPPRNETATPSGYEIFVGSLHPDATHEDLKKHFSTYGEVLNVFLHHDKKNNPPKNNFAYVRFADETARDAALAVDHEINGSPVHVDDNKKSSVSTAPLQGGRLIVNPERKKQKKSDDNKVFISNIPYSVGAESVKELFSQFGKISDVRMPLDRNDERFNRGFAFVSFLDKSSADNAIASEDLQIEGRTLAVKLFSKIERTKTNTPRDHEVFVGSLHPEVTSDDLEKHFSAHGKVLNVSIHNDKKNNPPRKSYAYVSFANETAKDAVLAAEHEIDGHPIYVAELRKKQIDGHALGVEEGKVSMDKQSLFVLGLNRKTSAATLALHFGRYGEVSGVAMEEDASGGSCAVVTFSDDASASAALAEDHQIDYSFVTIHRHKITSNNERSRRDRGKTCDRLNRRSDENEDDNSDIDEKEDDDSDIDNNEGDDSDIDEKEDDADSDIDKNEGDDSDIDEKEDDDDSDNDENEDDDSDIDENEDKDCDSDEKEDASVNDGRDVDKNGSREGNESDLDENAAGESEEESDC
ncbi:serine-aspartate repeat-containing protein C isoform X2 [Hyalella azteca]|uniref:Serine-aspartate repeat-containing protein C isoform X2 n=1 Tax=Hyalella azteca TaxID=294128 RepID=A0A8B7NSS7_HYAAZ|nr:serine-aspartate repeat-containing protein C isoform X2 [Hyalella azteca]